MSVLQNVKLVSLCCFIAFCAVIFPFSLFLTGMNKQYIKDKKNLISQYENEIKYIRSVYETELTNHQIESDSIKSELTCIIDQKNEEIITFQNKVKNLELEHEAMYRVKASFYTASRDECDDDPHITATMTTPTVGRTIAVSRDLFPLLKGRKIYVQGFGIFTVEDTMNARFKNKCDILVPTKNIAKNLGIKELKIFVLPENEC